MHTIKDTVKQLVGKSLDAYNANYTKPINDRIDNIVAQAGTDNTEIVDARIDSAGVSHTTLNNRILAETKMTDEKLIEYTGSSLSVDDTMPGYLQNIEIKGNTIQNEDNLEDIRSVGDKIEGQELYEIPVLSVGKNLFNIKEPFNKTYSDNWGKEVVVTNGIVSTSGLAGIESSKSQSYKFKPNTNYTFSAEAMSCGFTVRIYNQSTRTNIREGTILTNKRSFITFNTSNIPSDDIRIVFHRLSDVPINTCGMFNIQIEEGTVATEYEPYQEDKITILSPTPLEKVGDVADRIIRKDGVWGVEKNIKTIYINSYASYGQNDSLKYYWITGNPIGENSEGISDLGKVNIVTNGTIMRFVQSGDMFATMDEFLNRIKLGVNIKYITCTPQFIPLPHDQQVKLRTFANKTNISFLTEIEGTIKAQVPKSLGATVNTHTEQISNLNKELDRVKKLEESTVSTVETESDFTTVEATSNGYFEDVKLEGKTLVNLVDNNSFTEVANYSSIVIDVTKFKPSTTYTLKLFGNLTTVKYIYMGSRDDTEIVIPRSTTTFIKFITPSNINSFTKEISLILYNNGTNFTSEICKTFKALILEGDHTQNPPSYFEGLKSVGQGTDEIVVSSVNKNLFEGNPYNEISSRRCFYVRQIDKFDNLTISYDVEIKSSGTGKMWVFLSNTYSNTINHDQLYQGVVANGKGVEYAFSKSTTINTSGYKYMYFTSGVSNENGVIYKNIQIEEGVVVTEYTPHQSDKKRLLYYNNETQTWEKPILREWDSIEKHSDGKYHYHQRSAEVVLNGSENWNNYDSLGTCTPYLVEIPKINFNHAPISDKFVGGIFDGRDGEKICVGGSPHIIIQKDNSTLSTQDVAGFKQWLQANNVTVAYQLSQEKVYECTNIDLITYANETNYIVESGAIVPRSTLKVHNNISNIVSLLQKKVSLLESNMTKYMITQNRMQLASTYSADSVTFKVDYALYSEEVEYNEDLYNLILNNILVGKDNYDYDKMFNIILDYASWNQISWEQFDILVGLMDMQHNPPVEDEIVEEIPNEIM